MVEQGTEEEHWTIFTGLAALCILSPITSPIVDTIVYILTEEAKPGVSFLLSDILVL
jgi:hypothetical protein